MGAQLLRDVSRLGKHFLTRNILENALPAGNLKPFLSLKSSSYRHHFIEAVRLSVIATFA